MSSRRNPFSVVKRFFIPLAENPWGFWIMAAIVASFTGIVDWNVFFKEKDGDNRL